MKDATEANTADNEDKNTASVKVDALALIEQVRAAQDAWHSTMFKSTNDKLLSLLADCLKAYRALADAGANARLAFQKKLAKEGLSYKEGVHLSTKIVHYVFRLRTGRASVYARVLRAAIRNKVEADVLPQWVESEGGIESVRRRGADEVSPSKKARETGKRAQQTLAGVAPEAALTELPQSLVPSDSAEHEFSVALVRVNAATSKAEVVWGSNNAALVRRVLDAVGKHVLDKCGDAQATRSAVDRVEQRKQMIDIAVNSNVLNQPQVA